MGLVTFTMSGERSTLSRVLRRSTHDRLSDHDPELDIEAQRLPETETTVPNPPRTYSRPTLREDALRRRRRNLLFAKIGLYFVGFLMAVSLAILINKNVGQVSKYRELETWLFTYGATSVVLGLNSLFHNKIVRKWDDIKGVDRESFVLCADIVIYVVFAPVASYLFMAISREV
jgi:hypothetical protein